MTAQEFAYWLQGFAELTGDNSPSPTQWKSIKEHLALVFNKVTPSVDAAVADPLDRVVRERREPRRLCSADTISTC